MAEVLAQEMNPVTDQDGSDSSAVGHIKPLKQDGQPSENGLAEGISDDEKSPPLNGISGNHAVESSNPESKEGTDKQGNKPLENGKAAVDMMDQNESTKDSAEASEDSLAGQTPAISSDNNEIESVESEGNRESPVIVNSDDATPSDENSSEPMEVDSVNLNDDDSNFVDLSSNVSAPTSDVVEIDANNSKNPSLVSEDSSRDSVESIDSGKSNASSKSKSDSQVEKVKGEEGDDILITLNNEEETENKRDEEIDETAENESSKDDKPSTEESALDKKDEGKELMDDNTVKSKSNEETEVGESKQGALKSSTAPIVSMPSAVSVSAATSLLFPAGQVPIVSTVANFIPVQGGSIAIPAGYQLVQQGNQFGYITVVGNQRIFVPATTVIPATSVKSSMIANQLSTVYPSQQKQTSQQPNLKPEDLQPKSSWEMIELMKWEVQNRIPDNYNWSVAFHKRKDELSSITTFLQELGSDVVKEQVYKDIIQIQTKKKESGDLKDAEIESLEKMKTVYENTKKKVEHLQLETKECTECKFKTESDVIMSYHKDFPHYDPPWDVNRGWLVCAQLDCDFRTKTVAHFIFHQKDIHNVQAKFLEKEQYFQCSLCPLNASTKNKLERHQQKCMRNFKLNLNLQPYYHDTNFCMKTCFFKPKKVVPKPPPPPPKPAVKPSMLTRQQGTTPGIQLAHQHAPLKPITQAPVSQPINVALRQRLPVVAGQSFVPQLQQPQARPRLTPPPLQRAPVPQQQQRPARPPGKEMSGFEVCELCGGYVKDRQALRIHFYYAHKVEMPQAIFNRPNPPLTCDVCKSHYWTTQGLAKHKAATQHFIGSKSRQPPAQTKIPAEQECFMCLKQFPNLFVHFERVHGMTMKDLVLVRKCIMCGFAASDYKTLESHLGNAHGVLIKVNDYLVDKNKPAKTVPSIISGGKNVGKINYCVFCQIQYPDNIQLTIHCIKTHATCEKCGMVVASSDRLSEHVCRKAHINRSCYICGTVVSTQEKYALHLRLHVKPCRVRLENLTDEEIEELKDKIKREYKPAVISLDSDDDSDVEVVETKPSNMKVVLEKEGEKDVEMVDLSADSDKKREKKEKEDDDRKENGEENEKEPVDKEEDKQDKVSDDNKEEKIESDADSKDKVKLKDDEHTENDTEKDIKQKSKESVTESKENIALDENIQEIESEKSVQKSESKVKSDSNGIKETDDKKEINDNKESKTLEKSAMETEEELEKRLLGKDYDDEDSVLSSGSRKRKISESEIDEDELLKDDDDIDSKRLKMDEKNHENTSDKTVTVIKESDDSSVQETEMGCSEEDKDKSGII